MSSQTNTEYRQTIESLFTTLENIDRQIKQLNLEPHTGGPLSLDFLRVILLQRNRVDVLEELTEKLESDTDVPEGDLENMSFRLQRMKDSLRLLKILDPADQDIPSMEYRIKEAERSIAVATLFDDMLKQIDQNKPVPEKPDQETVDSDSDDDSESDTDSDGDVEMKPGDVLGMLRLLAALTAGRGH